MSAVRIVTYVVDPFGDERQPIAALVQDGCGVRVVRAPVLRVPAGSRANVDRVLRDLEEAPRFDALPIGAGPQVVAGDARTIPLGVTDAPSWVREVLLTRVA
jgi:hypothetical protein